MPAKNFFYAIVIISMTVLQSCTGDNNSTNSSTNDDTLSSVKFEDSVIHQKNWKEEPFENITIPFTTHKYNNKSGLTFQSPAGSLIEIPANAFEDKNGNPVSKNIVIKYREFHSITDVMLAGIKMKYSESDTSGADFETAGMFEIRAFAGDDELTLRKDKKIDLKLGSYKSGDFNHYAMDEKSNEWKFIERKSPEPNTLKKEKIEQAETLLQMLETVCTNEPTEFKKDMEVFDIVYDFRRFREMEMFHDAMWICAGDKQEKEDMKKNFKGYDQMSLEESDSCGVFNLTMWKQDGSGQAQNKKVFKVKPVWAGESFVRRKKDYKEKLEIFKKIKDEMEIARREADLWRSFQLKGMGVFNCDRIVDLGKFIAVSLAVLFKDKIKSFFYITNNGQVAVKYYQPYLSEFRVNPNSTNSIIAILPNGKVGTVSEEAFETALQNYQENPNKDKNLELELIEQPDPVTDKKSFEQHVARF